MKQKVKKYHSSIDPSSKEVGFVEVNRPLNVSTSQSLLNCSRAEIQRKDGSRLTLYGQEGHILDGKTLVRAFLGEDHASNCSTD